LTHLCYSHRANHSRWVCTDIIDTMQIITGG